MGNKIIGLGRTCHHSQDVQLSLPFYTEVLGLQFLFAPTEQLAFVQCGDTRLMLSQPQEAQAKLAKTSIPCLKTTDIEQFYAKDFRALAL